MLSTSACSRARCVVSDPDANAKEDLPELDVSFSSGDTLQGPDASWVADAEFTLTIVGATPKASLEQRHSEDAWDGNADFTLRINGKTLMTKRS